MNQILSRNKILGIDLTKKRIETVIFALMLTIVLSVSAAVVLYRLSPMWSPFRLVEAQTRNFGQAVKVVFESNMPLKTRLEYGTSQEYLNTTEESESYGMRHEIYVASILPGKRHFIKLVGYTEDGKVYESKFFTVE